MTGRAIKDPVFTYVATTQWGNVLLSPLPSNWYEVRFQGFFPDEDEEVLGTFPTELLAAQSAKAGEVDTPSIGVCLSEMGLPEDIRDWDRHLAGWKS